MLYYIAIRDARVVAYGDTGESDSIEIDPVDEILYFESENEMRSALDAIGDSV